MSGNWGPHRLICGDASDPAVIAALMQGEQASLCFTSPPYGNQRDYTSPAALQGLGWPDARRVRASAHGRRWLKCWSTWALSTATTRSSRIGMAGLTWMRSQGWRRFAWYVWDQGPGMPGDWQGRLAPSV
jgi:DNA modification methylase